MELTHLPSQIAAMNVTITFSWRIIHGIWLRNINNTGARGEIIDGGIGYNFVKFRLVGHTNHLLYVAWFFYDPSVNTLPPTTTTSEPDYYVQHWGTVHSHSTLISK